MRKVRNIIYKMGFRPKAGSIFHSPSLHLLHLMTNAQRLMVEEAIKERKRKNK